jgi:4-hydroxybenzoyl-CoA reductase subunit beta
MGTLGGNLCLDTRCRYYNQTYFWRSALGYCLKKDGTQCHVVKGGQRCVAAASNDSAPALLALGASFTLLSARGERLVPSADFYTADGIHNTVLEPGEILTTIRVPLLANRKSAFTKLRRRAAIDFPLLSIAARVDRDGDALRAVELVVSALAARPRRVAAAARLAPGARPTAELRAQLAQAAKKECRPLDNIEGDPAWRHEMVPVLVERLLARLGVG